jgi:predicted metalloprotease
VYGHHIQHLLGIDQRIQAGDTGPASGWERLELQADCYAGVWVNHAPTVPTASGQPLLTGLTQAELDATLDTVSRLGDDDVRSALGGGGTDQSHFTHGISAQRVKWYSIGYETGDPARCDTFARGVDLG